MKANIWKIAFMRQNMNYVHFLVYVTCKPGLILLDLSSPYILHQAWCLIDAQ
jgi:hypothetical protein